MKTIITISLLLFTVASCHVRDKEYEISKDVNNQQDLFNATLDDGISCYRIPAIVTAPNGDLIAAIDERKPSCDDLRTSKDINIVVRRSTDNGRTWSAIETVIDFPFGKSASDPSMIVDKVSNEIFLFYNYMDLDVGKDIYYFHLVKSTDNGKTWSKPQDITSQIAKLKWHNDFKFITSGRGIQTREGRLLHTMVNLERGLFVFGSDDHGKSWFFIDTPITPADESKIVELADGSLMINSRVKGVGMRYVHTSTDEGITWISKPEPNLIDPANNASIIRYTAIEDGFKKNRLLFANAKSEKGRTNMTVRVSYDDGKSWTKGKTIYQGHAAYSSLTILKNGDIGLFFEKDEYTENVFLSVSLKWLTDGADEYKSPME
jgi:sialidase-1